MDARVRHSAMLRGAVGNGGINIQTGSLFTNGAQLDATTFAQGNAGSVNIFARDTVSFDGVGSDGGPSAVFSLVAKGAVGGRRHQHTDWVAQCVQWRLTECQQ